MTQFSLKKGCLSGSTLKIIAIIAMAIDHFAASIILYGILMQQNPSFLGHPVSMTIPWWNIYQVMRFIGRIGFPVFCFLLIEGFLHTSSKKKYATRLFLFALVSEFPFDYALFICGKTVLSGLSECLFHFIPGSPDHLGHRYCKPQRNKPEPSVDRQDPARRRRLSDRLAPSDRLRLQRNHPDPVTLPVPRSEVSLHSGLLHESLMGSPRLPRLHPDQPL